MDAREVRKERRQEAVRDEILEAARVVLLQKGLAGLTLAAVARQVQLTKAALYYYFPSKDALAFELVYRSLEAHAEAVGKAVDTTTSGSEAIEALIRASARHYATRKDELRLAYLVPQVGSASTRRLDPAELARLRPFNERMYGTVGDKIAKDQQAGLIATHIDGRRVAFVAHMAVIGVLIMEGLIEVMDTAPLIHSSDAMIEELVCTFTARLHLETSGSAPDRQT
jgi:AcrR family transcriptional regulator